MCLVTDPLFTESTPIDRTDPRGPVVEAVGSCVDQAGGTDAPIDGSVFTIGDRSEGEQMPSNGSLVTSVSVMVPSTEAFWILAREW